MPGGFKNWLWPTKSRPHAELLWGMFRSWKARLRQLARKLRAPNVLRTSEPSTPDIFNNEGGNYEAQTPSIHQLPAPSRLLTLTISNE
jgi:hypothetical protein